MLASINSVYVYVAAITFCGSAYAAMTARWRITEVPWYMFVRHPSYFAGRNQLVSGVGWFLIWCSLSSFIGVISAITATHGISYIPLFTDSAPQLVLTISFVIVIHLIVIGRTKKLVRRNTEVVPESATRGLDDAFEKYAALLRRYTERPTEKSKSRFYFTILFDFVPVLIAPFYMYFYESSNLLINGCTNILFEHYRRRTIIEFYEFHKSHTDDAKRFAGIERKLAKCERNSNDYARHILIGMIRMIGYRALKSAV